MVADNSMNRIVAANKVADPNPLLAEWEGPYGGVPPFDKVQIAFFKPALEAAMSENLAEVENIARVRSAPTFENTIVALEKAGHTLDRVTTIYGIWARNDCRRLNSRPYSARWRPSWPAFNDQITQNEPLFKRIEAVYNSPDKKKLTPEQQRLVWLYYTNFVRSGREARATGKSAADGNQSTARDAVH